ncbi:MAG: Fic family protein [Spirochaetales bacterium]|nr:Fic family protein [Spirochaetales bacterium]
MRQLIIWTKNSKLHPLIKACIFHYEFEYIHPFTDGNGRTGRFWHTLILSKWEPLFAWIPIENLIHKRQSDYYKAISDSDKAGNSTAFILFMTGGESHRISQRKWPACTRRLKQDRPLGSLRLSSSLQCSKSSLQVGDDVIDMLSSD